MKKLRYLIAPCSLLVVFIIWTVLVETVDVRYIQGIGNLGFYSSNTSFNAFLQGMNTHLFKVLSDILLYLSIATVALFAALGLVQLIKRKSLAKVDPILYIALGGYILIAIFYFVFELYKINFGPTSTPEHLKASYPSSHVFIFITLVGIALIVLKRYKDNKTVKRIAYIEFALLAFLMTLLRLFSGQHYMTDIIGGVLLGLTIVTAVFEFDRFFFSEIKQEVNND